MSSPSVASAIGFGAGTFAWFYARTFMTEPTSTLFLMLAFYGLLVSSAGDTRLFWLSMSGLGLALAIFVRLQNAVALPVLAAWLIWMLRARGRDFRAGLVALAVWSAPILLSFSMIAGYNYLRFGSATETCFAPESAPLELARAIFQNPFYTGVYGLLLSPGKGMFWYAPVLIPAMYGWRFLWHKSPGTTAVLGMFVGSYLLFYAPEPWAGNLPHRRIEDLCPIA